MNLVLGPMVPNREIYDVCKHLQANVDGGQWLILLSLSSGTSEVLSNRLLRVKKPVGHTERNLERNKLGENL